MSRLTTHRIKLFIILVTLSVLVGLVENYFTYPSNENGSSFNNYFVRDLSGWIVGSTMLWSFELFFIPSRLGIVFRRMHFLSAIIVKSLVVAVIVASAAIITGYVFKGEFNTVFFTQSHFTRILTIVFILIIVLQTATQVVRIIGANTLLNIMLGKYRQPVHEDKIFMILDITGSTALAEKLGDLGVQSMLNKFFFDITDPILEHGGEIYRYVGDQVIVTWDLKTGPINMRVIRCCFAINKLIMTKSHEYQRTFGMVPSFRIGLHGGPVVMGQCGDQKQEISYFGDTINTAARIEHQCKALDCSLVISSELLNRISLTDDYKAERLATVQLRGRQVETELFTIKAV